MNNSDVPRKNVSVRGTEKLSESTWAVTVERDGEQILTIASNHLSGRDLTAADDSTIRTAAEHLLSFVGKEMR